MFELKQAMRSGKKLEERLREYTERRKRANAFDLGYAGDVAQKGERWELARKSSPATT